MFRRTMLATVAVLAAAVAVAAQPAGIEGPAKAEPYKMLDHSVSGDWESAIWDVQPPKADLRASSDGKTLTWVAPPGAYTVEAVVVNFTGKRINRFKLPVLIGTPGPQPDPQPDPDPKPSPNPEPGPKPDPSKLWVVVVEESAQRTPAHATVILSQEFRATVPQGQWRLVDKDTPVAQGLQSYVDRAKGRTLPQMFVVDTAGKILWEGPLPGTPADAVGVVEKVKKGG